MKQLHRLALACVVAGSVFASPFAAAHAALKGSVPAADAIVEASPKEIVLTFNEKVEESFSSVVLKDAGGKDVATGKAHVDAANAAILRVDVPAALAAGVYNVQWTAVGHDGHRRTGTFKFTVK